MAKCPVLDFTQLGEAANLQIFGDEDIAVTIEDGAMGSDKFPGFERVAAYGCSKFSALVVGILAVAQLRHDFVFAIQNGDAGA